MLSVCAVIGAVIDVDLLHAVLDDMDEFTFLDALDDLLSRHILRETGHPKRVEFTHDLMREVTLEQLSQSRKRGLNQTVGELLELQRGEGKLVPLTVLGEYFAAAGEANKAFNYLLLAGEQAAQSLARDDAIKILERAKALLTEDADDASRYRLWMTLARSYLGSETPKSSDQYLELAYQVATTPIERAKAIEGRVELSFRNGESDAALDLVDRGLQELGLRIKKSWFGLLWDINYGTLFATVFPEPLRRLITRNHRRPHYEAAYDLYHYAAVVYHASQFPEILAGVVPVVHRELQER